MRIVRMRHTAEHWTAATPAEGPGTALRRWMAVAIVAGVGLCLACCSVVGYFITG
ncbi:MAG: hypothetical protein ACP5J4_20380 [Anaerolineae bacterium]